MIILHTGFLEGRLHLWGEAGIEMKVAPAKKVRGSGPKPSPYNPTKKQFEDACWEADLSFEIETISSITAWLPSSSKAPLPSSLLLTEDGALLQEEEGIISPWQITAVPLSMGQAIDLLIESDEQSILAPGVVVGEDLKYCATVFRYASLLVTNEQFLPGLSEKNDTFYARWKPVFLGEEAVRLASLAAAMPASVRALSRKDEPATPASAVLEDLLNTFVDYLVRNAWLNAQKSPGRPASFDSIHDQWLFALRAAEGVMKGPWAEMAHLNEQIEAWQRPIAVSTQTPFQLVFRLEEPDMFSGEAWYVRFLLQAIDDPSLLVDVEKAWDPDKRTMALFEKRGFRVHEYLLVSLGQAAGLVPVMEESLKRPRPGGFLLRTEEAYKFLSETAWLLRQAGFGVLLPSWWMRKGTRRRLTAQASVTSPKMKASAGLSMDAIVQFNWQVALGDEVLSQEEIEMLSRAKLPLVNLRGQWVHVDLSTIQSAVEFWKKAGSRETTARDVVRMSLGMTDAPGGLPFEGVEASGWMKDFLHKIEDRASVEEIDVAEGFEGTLRPYQSRGYAWLAFLDRWGFGACLADDMGLGKTIQTLALIQRNYRMNPKKPVLLVCPTSVMGNWQKEAARFTPDLPVLLHHGAQREKKLAAFRKLIKGNAIVITGYPLLHRDFDILSKISWYSVVLDEAQNIKNSETKQSRAARMIQADHRIALTGTPVENNIGELWSIMEFLNPGFLGKAADFKRRFFAPIQIERDREAMEHLKRITGPFILRRLKTDKTIIDDLPKKLEMNVFTTLTKEQASLYEAVVREMSEALESSDGIQRKGMVLATLTKLKQICNHPAQFLHDESKIPERSGKLTRLTEMLEEILNAGERALIFTQFTEMGTMIRRHLQELFGREVLFLHGGVSKKNRDMMVERFQKKEGGPAIFLLSLKAGGTGLNLTRANHVFHFDRWWNPAVENQATDRAFRIGQTRQVQVHKFVCLGTVEERIDEMIENKREIAESTIGAGEKWITELSTDKLKSLFELRKEAVEG